MMRAAHYAALCGGAVISLLFGKGAHAEPPALPPTSEQTIDYARDVQPLLARSCLKCHGPAKQESAFRVDRRKSLVAGGDLGEPGVVPGKSATSHLIRLVAGVGDEVMPPEGTRLTAAEVGLLRAWIDQGLKMPAEEGEESLVATKHWSFQPLARAAVPVARPSQVEPPGLGRPGYSVNPIDAFVLQKLNAARLAPSPPAERRVLIRRLYLDMLGLLPSPEKVQAFEQDASPDAYRTLVERVLASPHYGERWARHWLDVVRFAESNGFETNYERPNAFQYRDWVIRALNEDLPYDRFVFAQIAGDSTGDDAATGFLVGGATDAVKSPDPALTAMQRQDELADMVNTTGTAFLGLTLGCARCHTHKFDPILQKDYYSLQAVFAGVQHGERPLQTPAESGSREELARINARMNDIKLALARLPILPAVSAKENEERFPPTKARFVRFTIEATNSAEPCIDELEIWTAGDKPENVALAAAGAKATSSGDYQGNPKHLLAHVNDGQYSNDRSWISNQLGGGWVQIELAAPREIDRIVWGRDRTLAYKDRLATKYRIEAAEEAGRWQVVADSRRRLPFGGGAPDAAAFRAAGLSKEDADRAIALGKESEQLAARKGQLSARPMAYAGTFTTPPATHRLHRGDPLAKRELVGPESLTALHAQVGSLALAADAPEQQRRVALARWIASPKNPLTPRVIVNRLWHYHFGRGLAPTPSDLGAMGGKPTHPELLDWLAAELIARQWSLKEIHRLILLSATYQQASLPRAEALAKDREATLLWRFPPRRLEAEAIRDNVLLVSGSLDQRMFGPGYLLFEPNANYSRNWIPKDDFGPAEFRRLIYALDLRMKQDSVFGAFDCPDGGQIAPTRSRSTTPIQALNLFNSGFMAQQAIAAAQRIARDVSPEHAQQVERLYWLAFGRSPTAEERDEAAALVKAHGLAAVCRAVFNSNEFLFLP